MAKLTRAVVRRLIEKPQPCILCGDWEAAMAGLFSPTVPELWGGVRGKQRLIVYRLCLDCADLPERCDKVEARIQAHLGARRN
jgi:hypothetical protein